MSGGGHGPNLCSDILLGLLAVDVKFLWRFLDVIRSGFSFPLDAFKESIQDHSAPWISGPWEASALLGALSLDIEILGAYCIQIPAEE